MDPSTPDRSPPPEGASDSLTLFDGAHRSPEEETPEFEDLRAIAADTGRPLLERLEAFEDIIDSEVGDTSLTRARNLERQSGPRQIYLKFEGGNPSGTQKDRIAFAQVQDALRRAFDTITVATCGNYGAALAPAAALAGLRCIIFVPESYHPKRIEEMTSSGAEVMRTQGDYEAAVAESMNRAAQDDMYDANPGGTNSSLQLTAYGQIAYEIYDELRDAPAAVAVPVSNGTTLAGIYRGFVSLHRRGRTSRIPRMVAGSSHGKNPIVRSFLKGLEECTDLNPETVRETEVNEPLINWHSSEGDLALQAIRQTGGWAAYASDRRMRSHARVLRDQEGLSVLPASTAGLVVLIDHHRGATLPSDRYVVVLTGRR